MVKIEVEGESIALTPLQDDRFAVLTFKKKLRIFRLWIEGNNISWEILDDIDVEGIEGREEKCSSMINDENKKFIITCQHEFPRASSISVYKISQEFKLEFKTVLDVLNLVEINFIGCFNLIGNYKEGVVFSGLSHFGNNRPFLTFCYDSGKNSVKEIEELRTPVNGETVYRLQKIEEGVLAGVGRDLKMIQVKYVNFE